VPDLCAVEDEGLEMSAKNIAALRFVSKSVSILLEDQE